MYYIFFKFPLFDFFENSIFRIFEIRIFFHISIATHIWAVILTEVFVFFFLSAQHFAFQCVIANHQHFNHFSENFLWKKSHTLTHFITRFATHFTRCLGNGLRNNQFWATRCENKTICRLNITFWRHTSI